MQGAQTENEMVNQPHPNRLNSVIAKIERLYMVRFPIFLTIVSIDYLNK